MYFVLENSLDDYELAKPVVDNDNTYTITDTEYAVAGHNYKQENNNDNVYGHSMDNMYDSMIHARKESQSENQYDHFVGKKTEDDYDISRR